MRPVRLSDLPPMMSARADSGGQVHTAFPAGASERREGWGYWEKNCGDRSFDWLLLHPGSGSYWLLVILSAIQRDLEATIMGRTWISKINWTGNTSIEAGPPGNPKSCRLVVLNAGPRTSSSSSFTWELLEMQILSPHPSTTESETQAGLSISVFTSPMRDSECLLGFEDHGPRPSLIPCGHQPFQSHLPKSSSLFLKLLWWDLSWVFRWGAQRSGALPLWAFLLSGTQVLFLQVEDPGSRDGPVFHTKHLYAAMGTELVATQPDTLGASAWPHCAHDKPLTQWSHW